MTSGASTSTAARLLTAEQLADRWQLLDKQGAPSTSHVYRLTREGRLPVVKLGRYYRYRVPDVEAFEAAGGTGAQP